jgi:hypothetical protein
MLHLLMQCRQTTRLEGLQARICFSYNTKQLSGLKRYHSPHNMRDLVSRFPGSRSYAAIADAVSPNKTAGGLASQFSLTFYNTKNYFHASKHVTLHIIREILSRAFPPGGQQI